MANFSETSVYNGPRGSYFSSWGNTRAIFTHRPFWLSGSAAMWELGSLQTGDNSGFMGTAPRYDPKQLLAALRALLAAVAAEPGLRQSKSLAVDVIDLTAATMANLYILHITDLVLVTNGTMTAASPGRVKMIAAELISAIAATDELLASNENYLLGKWISDARSFGTTDAEKALLEFNARNQVCHNREIETQTRTHTHTHTHTHTQRTEGVSLPVFVGTSYFADMWKCFVTS